MGQGKRFRYRMVRKDSGELRIQGGRLYAERVTAEYSGGITSTGEWTPAVDVFETADCLYLVAEVAGLGQQDLAVEVSGRVVTLRGRRPFTRKGLSSESYYRMERSYGTFERSFTLPCAVSDSQVKAVLKDGVLTVRLQRA